MWVAVDGHQHPAAGLDHARELADALRHVGEQHHAELRSGDVEAVVVEGERVAVHDVGLHGERFVARAAFEAIEHRRGQVGGHHPRAEARRRDAERAAARRHVEEPHARDAVRRGAGSRFPTTSAMACSCGRSPPRSDPRRIARRAEVLHHHRDRLLQDVGGAELDELGTGVVDGRVAGRRVVGVAGRVRLLVVGEPERHSSAEHVAPARQLAAVVGQPAEQVCEITVRAVRLEADRVAALKMLDADVKAVGGERLRRRLCWLAARSGSETTLRAAARRHIAGFHQLRGRSAWSFLTTRTGHTR